MVLTRIRCAAMAARGALAACLLGIGAPTASLAQEFGIEEEAAVEEFDESVESPGPLLSADSPFGGSQIEMEEVPRGEEGPDDSEFLSPDAAKFDRWNSVVEEEPVHHHDKAHLRPFDWMRHWGFHHSSTDGRYTDKNVPLNYSSWLNRPFHVDWFAGPLLSDGPVRGRVQQQNDLLLGLRAGWDFDYYWGIEWRFGWSDPDLFVSNSDFEFSGTYFVSDIDLVYYPWGDTRVRPYFVAGLGMTRIGNVREDFDGQEAVLLGMPFGIGVQFKQYPWLAWRLEIIDNLAFGADGVDTMNNIAFTAGMEWRLGARPNSYWPWRQSRKIW